MSGTRTLEPTTIDEFGFLCEVLARKPLSPALADALASPERIGGLMRLAERERLMPVLHEALEARYSRFVSRADRAILATRYELNRRRNRALMQVLLEFGEVSERAGIEAVALKGAAWLIEQPDDYAASRQMVDLDVLVQPKQFDQIPALLEGIGYRRATEDRRFERNFHMAPYWHPEVPVTLEIHRHLGWRHELLPPALLLAESKAVAPGLRLPLPWTRLFHAIIHWQIQDQGSSRGSLPLKEIQEVARFLARPDVDWERLWSQAKATGCDAVCGNAVIAAVELLGARLPAKSAQTGVGRSWLDRALARRASPRATWLATEKFRAGSLWRCEKLRYRSALDGVGPDLISLKIFLARIIRLPLLGVRVIGIVLKAIVSRPWAKEYAGA